uniref:Smoothelin domain-containing protein n=1 Tax=Calidris pygmaea TaxID=425635 RepID=A0A8C3JRM9_9CHAR
MPCPTVTWANLGGCEGGSSLVPDSLACGRGLLPEFTNCPQGDFAPEHPRQLLAAFSPSVRRSRRLEEEQQAALAALSRQLEAITDVEELTKLLRAAGEYEERKLIRAAIRKLRAEEIEAATLAGNTQSRRKDGSEPPAVPGDVKSSQRDDAETPAQAGSGKNSPRSNTELPALAESREGHGEGSTEPLTTARSEESSQRDDAEQPTLAVPDESGRGGAAELCSAQEPEGSAVSAQDTAGGTGPLETSLPFPWAPVPACLEHKPPGKLGLPT